MNQNTINHNYLRSNSVRDSKIINYWYTRSKDEDDINKKEEFANKAVFKSPQVAHREFLKANLKEKTRISDHHSNTILTILDKGEFGISTTKSIVSCGEDSVCSEQKITYGKPNPNLIPQYLIDNDTVKHYAIFSTILKIASTDAERLIAAYLIMSSGYDKILSFEEYGCFEREFEYLHAIMNKRDRINMIDLWMKSSEFKHILGYSVSKYALSIANDSVIEKFKNAYGSR